MIRFFRAHGLIEIALRKATEEKEASTISMSWKIGRYHMTPAEERLVFESLEFLIEHCIRRGVKKDDGEYDFSEDDKRRLELAKQLRSASLRRPAH